MIEAKSRSKNASAFLIESVVAVATLCFTVIQIATAKPSGMGKLGPEGVPAAAGIFAAASVCIAADSVLVRVLVVVAVIDALGRFTVDFRIAVTAAVWLHYCFRRTAATGTIGHNRDFRSGSIRGNIFRCSTLMSHKKYRHSPRRFFLYPSRA